ncbi:hypothetical protein R3P38DRAFT_3190449 [Favolaschia claudopus]|uniref:RING-type domain-containing protein n=1 Tax=Favolaschia claudopus TaxID=2862362 RepID=A0AAW0BMG5_9AGAR
MDFPRARLYQSSIKDAFARGLRTTATPVPAVDPSPSHALQTDPFENYRRFTKDSGTRSHLAIDVDVWHALPSIEVHSSAENSPVHGDAAEGATNAILRNARLPPLPPTDYIEYGGDPEHDIAELFTCSICWETFNLPVVLLCVHVFCDACMARAMERAGTCPLCRGEITENPIQDELFERELARAIAENDVEAPTSRTRIPPYVWPHVMSGPTYNVE